MDGSGWKYHEGLRLFVPRSALEAAIEGEEEDGLRRHRPRHRRPEAPKQSLRAEGFHGGNGRRAVVLRVDLHRVEGRQDKTAQESGDASCGHAYREGSHGPGFS